MSTLPRKTYNIRIEGGQPFARQIKADPPLIHNGEQTLWAGHMDQETHHQLMRVLTDTCPTGSISCNLTAESESQKAVRAKRAQDGIPFFQTPECPLCFFYDLDTENQCGLDDWDSPTIKTAMDSESATKSRSSCPLGK